MCVFFTVSQLPVAPSPPSRFFVCTSPSPRRRSHWSPWCRRPRRVWWRGLSCAPRCPAGPAAPATSYGRSWWCPCESELLAFKILETSMNPASHLMTKTILSEWWIGSPSVNEPLASWILITEKLGESQFANPRFKSKSLKSAMVKLQVFFGAHHPSCRGNPREFFGTALVIRRKDRLTAVFDHGKPGLKPAFDSRDSQIQGTHWIDELGTKNMWIHVLYHNTLWQTKVTMKNHNFS